MSEDKDFSWEPASHLPFKVIKWGPYDWTSCCPTAYCDIFYVSTIERAKNEIKYKWNGYTSRVWKRAFGLYIIPVAKN